MAKTQFKGNEVNTNGNLPQVGSKVPDFKLVKGDLSETTLSDFSGKNFIINIFPSIDTGVCAASVRRFNKIAAEKNIPVLCVSKDLPFAASRFCGAEGLDNVTTASDFRYNNFATDFGVLMEDGPLKGLCARAVVVVDENGVVTYTELVPEITSEPNYEIV